MADVIKFKEQLEEDPDFKNLFTEVTNLDEAVEIAKENGYDDLNVEDLYEDNELMDYMWEYVVGGKKRKGFKNNIIDLK